MKKKGNKNKLGEKSFLAMSTWTTDMMRDPNQFYKDMAALSAATKETEKKPK